MLINLLLLKWMFRHFKNLKTLKLGKYRYILKESILIKPNYFFTYLTMKLLLVSNKNELK